MYKKLLLAVSLMFGSTVVHANIYDCLDKKVESYRIVTGDQGSINRDVLEDWEYECEMGGYTPYQSDSDYQEQQASLPEYRLKIREGSNVFIMIQSMEDSLTIDEIIVNRGNCKSMNVNILRFPAAHFPTTIGYGESLQNPLVNSCKVLEVVVVANGFRITHLVAE